MSLLEKAATMKRFEYLPLGKELKAQTDIEKKSVSKIRQYIWAEFDKVIKKEKPTRKKYNKSNLTYGNKYSFYSCYNINNFNSLSPEPKYSILYSFITELNKFNNINPRKGQTKDKKTTVYDNFSELYNEYLGIYFNQYMTLSDAKKESWVIIEIRKNWFIDGCYYSEWSKNEEGSTVKEESTNKK